MKPVSQDIRRAVGSEIGNTVMIAIQKATSLNVRRTVFGGVYWTARQVGDTVGVAVASATLSELTCQLLDELTESGNAFLLV